MTKTIFAILFFFSCPLFFLSIFSVFINPLALDGHSEREKERYKDDFSCVTWPQYHFVPRRKREGVIHPGSDRDIMSDPIESLHLQRKNNMLIYHYQQHYTDEYSQRQTRNISEERHIDRESFVFFSPYLRWDQDGLYERSSSSYNKVLSWTEMMLRPWWCTYLLEDINNDTLWARKPQSHFGLYDLVEGISYSALDHVKSDDAFIVDPGRMWGHHFVYHDGRMRGEYHPFVSDGDVLYWFDEMISSPDQQPLTLYSWAYENKDWFFFLVYDQKISQRQKENINEVVAVLRQKVLDHFCAWKKWPMEQTCLSYIKTIIQDVIDNMHYRHKAIRQKTISDRE